MSFTKPATYLFVALALLHVCLAHADARPPARRALAKKQPVQSPAPQKLAPAKTYVEGELLVQYADAKALAAARALNARTGATVLAEFTFGAWQHIRLPAGLSVKPGLALYRKAAGVVAAQPNYVYHLADTTPNDPSYAAQYGLQKIQAPLAWDTTTGSSAVVVAVIDTGILYTHEDLAANMWHNPGEIPANGVDDDGDGYVDDVYGIDTANNDADPLDDFGHGTHVAGIVGAVGNNATGGAGVNWQVRLMALKMFDQHGDGTSATAIAAFQYVIMMKRRGVNVRVTNNSWGGDPEAPAFDQALKSAFDAAAAADILNVCAAGNFNTNSDATPFYPASYDSPHIVSVAASDSSDQRAGFSNYGATTVDLAAPGVSILSTYNGGNSSYAYLSGTSMAAPMVAGAAALLAAHDPALSALSIKAALLGSVDVLPQWSGLVRTGGRLNVARALQTSVACAFGVSPTSAAFTESGGTGNVNVTATAGCDWAATSNAAWLTINSGATGTGTGAVAYTVAPNGGVARTGTLVVAGQIVTVTQAAGVPPPDPTPTPAAAGQVLISEFRIDGPQGAEDQFVELYNNTDQPLTVWADDGSAGWALVSTTGANGVLDALCVIPNGTTLPTHGHYLYTPARGYSLASYGGANRAAADATGLAAYTHAADAPFAGLALFRTTDPANWTAAHRLDAVGGTLSSALLREGAGVAQNFGFVSDAQSSWVRRLASGVPQDTGDNAQDFVLVSIKGGVLGGLQATLGAPGPENLTSPIQRNAQIKASLVDTGVASTAPPNRVRDIAPVPNGALGTLVIRRKFRNGLNVSVTRLRFRVVDITTAPAPTPATADLRALDSMDVTVTTTGGNVLVKGTTVEQPPAQVLGGGLNSTFTVALTGGALTPGATVNVQFTLGVQQGGSFRFLINVEALP